MSHSFIVCYGMSPCVKVRISVSKSVKLCHDPLWCVNVCHDVFFMCVIMRPHASSCVTSTHSAS